MSGIKLTEDILLCELLELVPECRESLMEVGYKRIIDLDVEDIVTDKLSLKGFFRLMGLEEGQALNVLKQIQDLYNRKLEER